MPCLDLLTDFEQATENFEEVAKGYIDNNLLRYSVKTYLLMADIYYLAIKNLIAARRATKTCQSQSLADMLG